MAGSVAPTARAVLPPRNTRAPAAGSAGVYGLAVCVRMPPAGREESAASSASAREMPHCRASGGS